MRRGHNASPTLGGSITDLSVTDRCRWRGGDGNHHGACSAQSASQYCSHYKRNNLSLANQDAAGFKLGQLPSNPATLLSPFINGRRQLEPEFASLLTVGNTRFNAPVPAIPAEHSDRLIALGYLADIAGRLRMTTPGRIRI